MCKKETFSAYYNLFITLAGIIIIFTIMYELSSVYHTRIIIVVSLGLKELRVVSGVGLFGPGLGLKLTEFRA